MPSAISQRRARSRLMLPSSSRVLGWSEPLSSEQRPNLVLHLYLDRLGRAQNGARLQEIEAAEDPDIRADQNIRRSVLELLGRDRVHHHLDRDVDAFPGARHVAAD